MRTEHIGDATLYLADCMDIMRDMPDKAFDLAIVDPPYGLNINCNIGRRSGDIKKHAYKKWDMESPGSSYFIELQRVSQNQIVWGANNFSFLPPSNGWIVWDKDISGDVDFSECELAYSNCKNTVKRFLYRAQTNENYSEKIHPTQKPVALYKWLLSRYAHEGNTILDTHGGSGSSVIACLDMGYSITWIEKDEDYFNAALKRIEIAYRQPRLFDDPKPEPKIQELEL